MIYVGLDDTDELDGPGTNQLARHIVRELAGEFHGRMILRHQLLEDPRVPCTKKNGCASILLRPLSNISSEPSPPLGGEGSGEGGIATLIDRLRHLIVPWCAPGSDPGLCVTTTVPPAVINWGSRVQRELVSRQEAHEIAAAHQIHLEGLGGTQDGVIGALAAVGLMAAGNDGRVVYFGPAVEDWYDVTGCLPVSDILARGVDEVRVADGGATLVDGIVDIGKRLRPNYRDGKIVLYVARGDMPHWEAVRYT